MRDMYNTFNMGIGMVLALPADDAEKSAEIAARRRKQSAVWASSQLAKMPSW